MKKFLRNEGFTLVELMVVVAIIGILSAVAIPNFKQYQAKSKTSEAKLQLASIYSAETAFSSDWDNFGTCLNDMGYRVAARGYYVVGFAAESAANATAVANGATCAAGSFQLSPGTAGVLVAVGGAANVATFANLAGATVPADGSTFQARAAGRVATPTDDPDIDIWSIDQDKTVAHPTVGY